jgi:hypothetical protein
MRQNSDKEKLKKTQLLKNKTQVDKEVVNTEVVYNDSTKNNSVYQVVEDLKNDYLKYPETYIPLKWGQVEIVNAPSFKYRVQHLYKSSYFDYNINDTIENVEFNMIFHLSKYGHVVAITKTSEYDEWYTKDGLNYTFFSTVDFEKIGVHNKFDMLLKDPDRRKLQIVGGMAPEFEAEIGMSKSSFVIRNIKQAESSILKGIDSIDYCTNIAADDCFLYIFKGDTIFEIKNGL